MGFTGRKRSGKLINGTTMIVPGSDIGGMGAIRETNSNINKFKFGKTPAEPIVSNQPQIPFAPQPSPTPTPPPFSGDLILVFSNFDTVDLLLAGGVDSLPDWNSALVDSGTPYTSIAVDEGSFTVYLSGGSNITLKPNAFTGVVEGNLGLGEDLISIVDTGTIIESNGYTFNTCLILETVNLPTLTSVEISDFNTCYNLKTVQLPLVTSVGDYGFFGSFNTADSPMTLYLPLCTTFGPASFLQSDGLGGYVGTTEVDSPKVMNATFSTSVTMDPEITLLLAENSGIVATYV